MKLIVGLGNPGEQYEATRHNLGFLVVEHFLKDISSVKKSVWESNAKLKSQIVLTEWQPKNGSLVKLLLAKPDTYMNNSGMAVQLLMDFYAVDPSDVWVIHDDLDLPLGKCKIRFGGAAAGHHGVENIMQKIGTDKFWRFRLGIGNPKHIKNFSEDGNGKTVSRMHVGNTNDYVLGTFEGKERTETKQMVKDTVDALQTALEKGLEQAMNRFNTK